VSMTEISRVDRQFLAVAPLFFVATIEPAVAYYRDILGFTADGIWGEPPCFCMPRRDGLTVMLSDVDDKSRIKPNGSDGCSWDAYFWVRDADALFAEFKAKGVQVVHEPIDRPFYGNREFAISDLDGYIIAFAHTIAGKTGG
jgi:catechol 2,3-dioxygenase-like lactoylglutathione lyase family enzyme